MHWSVIKELSEFNTLAEEWNELLNISASHVPFLRHEYLAGWWQTLGGGEWAQAELCIVTARSEDGSLVGAAPLFSTKNLDGKNALMLIGSIEISDYLDLLSPVEAIPDFIQGLLTFLQGFEWDLLDLYNILDQSPTLPALKDTTLSKGWNYQEDALQHCPYIPIPGDWDEYLAGIQKKQRHEIRRKIKRAESYEAEWNEPVNWYFVEDGDILENEIDDFMSLMAQDAEKEQFLTPAMRKQMQLTARAAFDAGWLQLAFLKVGDKKAAGYLNFDYDNIIWVYNSGLNFEYRELSPGWVLLGYLLEWTNLNKRSRFDFMRGDEDYKYRFGGIDRRVMRVQISR